MEREPIYVVIEKEDVLCRQIIGVFKLKPDAEAMRDECDDAEIEEQYLIN